MKMSQIYRIFAIATFVLSTNCTTDGDVSDDGLAAADAGNQVVTAAPEEVSDSEIPNPEQVASEAAQAQEGEPQKPKDSAELVDPGRAAGMQELTSEQQLNGSTELPSESINESNDTYNLAQDNKAVQNLIDDTKQTGHNDPLPPLEHVVAEAEQPSPIAKKSLKPNKIDTPEIALAAESTEVSATDDSISVDSPKSTKSSKKHASKKTKVQPKAGLSDIVPANTYIVQPGDTLGKISTILYGSSGHWRELAQANNLSAQSHIYPGDMIKYDASTMASNFEQKFNALNRSKFIVKKGDTLASIAAEVMGNPAYWKLLWRWNESIVFNPQKIYEGQSLEYISVEQLAALHSESKNSELAH